jgi:hypothetical protein
MLRKILVGSLLIFFSPVPIAFSQNALTGFGGLEWGDSSSKFKQLEPSAKFIEGKKDFQSAIGSGKNANIGLDRTSAPRYFFYKDRYYLFLMGFEDEDSFTILEEALKSKYGPPKNEIPLVLQSKARERIGVKLYWEIKNKVSITLRWNQMRNAGELLYGYMPILEEIMKAQRELIKENL